MKSSNECNDFHLNISNKSFSTPFGSSIVTRGIPFYRQWTILYLQPVTILLSIIGNLLTLVVLPMRSVRMNPRCRYLYLFYTVSDTFLIFFKDIQDGYMADGLYWMSDGRINIYLELISSAGCKIFRGSRFSTEALAAYTIIIMNLERLVYLIIVLLARLRSMVLAYRTCTWTCTSTCECIVHVHEHVPYSTM